MAENHARQEILLAVSRIWQEIPIIGGHILQEITLGSDFSYQLVVRLAAETPSIMTLLN